MTRIKAPIMDLGLVFPEDGGPQYLEGPGDLGEKVWALGDVTRAFRGNMLATGYAVELALDTLLAEIVSPGLDPERYQRRELFTSVFLKRGSNFDRKIKALRTLRSALTLVQGYVSDRLLSELERFRLLRNDLAHYPVALVVVSRSPPEARAVLCGQSRDIELTGFFCGEEHMRAMQLAEYARRASIKLSAGAPPEDEQWI